MIQRREFITLLGGAAVTWPLAAPAQPRDRVCRVGVLMGLTAEDPESHARLAAFAQGLQQSGWTSVETSASNAVGPTAMPRPCANTPQNWSPSPPT